MIDYFLVKIYFQTHLYNCSMAFEKSKYKLIVSHLLDNNNAIEEKFGGEAKELYITNSIILYRLQ